jgi:hypothetical protein
MGQADAVPRGESLGGVILEVVWVTVERLRRVSATGVEQRKVETKFAPSHERKARTPQNLFSKV